MELTRLLWRFSEILEVKQLTPLLRSELGFWERWPWIHGKYYHLNNTKSSHIRTQLHTPASQHQHQTLGVTEAAARGPSPPHPQTSTGPGTQQDLKPAIPGPSPTHQGAGISPRNPWATQPADSGPGPTHHQASSHCTREGMAAKQAANQPHLPAFPQ